MLWELLSSISMEDGLVAWGQEEHTNHKREHRELQGKGESFSSTTNKTSYVTYKSHRT